MVKEINSIIISRKTRTGYRFINRFSGYRLTSLICNFVTDLYIILLRYSPMNDMTALCSFQSVINTRILSYLTVKHGQRIAL